MVACLLGWLRTRRAISSGGVRGPSDGRSITGTAFEILSRWLPDAGERLRTTALGLWLEIHGAQSLALILVGVAAVDIAERHVAEEGLQCVEPRLLTVHRGFSFVQCADESRST